MIFQKEIAEKAHEWEVPATTVDKDYVLGHFLNSFFDFENNRNRFVFKGGTCLRKCYFPNYRFSEDFDFTLIDPNLLADETFILKIIETCTQNTGNQFNLMKFEKKQFQNEDKGYKFVIGFWGANHSRNKPPAPKESWTTKIEMDISFDEEILFSVQQKLINHPYSDNNLISKNTIPVYALEEILTEKVRAFYQRSYKAPRFFYDVWYLLQNHTFEDWKNISQILKEKCNLKNKEANPLLFSNEEVRKSISKSWNESIAHHLPSKQLPEFQEIWSLLREKLFTVYLKI